MLRMTLLGVGTAVPDPDRENTHMVWESPEGLLLIDAGGSTYQRLLRAKLDPLKLQGLVVTHSHADHINGIAVLLFQLKLVSYSRTLPIYGNAETLEDVKRVVEAFRLESYQIDVEWVEVKAGDEIPVNSPSYRLFTAETVHSRPALALRFEASLGNHALVYSADTEPCDAVRALAQNADVLIHEATTAKPFAGHTSPRQAGNVAAYANAKHLVLVHFSPRWTMSASEAIEEIRAGGFIGDAEIGREFGTYTIQS